MSATYTLPWASARDEVRGTIRDTTLASAIFQDEELDGFLLAEAGDARLASARALEAMAAEYARGAISWSVPGFSLSRQATYKALLDAAARLREAAAAVPFEFESVLDHYVDAAGIDRSNYADTLDGGRAPELGAP